jgi:hypothetical protein
MAILAHLYLIPLPCYVRCNHVFHPGIREKFSDFVSAARAGASGVVGSAEKIEFLAIHFRDLPLLILEGLSVNGLVLHFRPSKTARHR